MDAGTLNFDDALQYILAGKSIFTVTSTKTNKHFTFKVKKSDNKGMKLWFVSVLTGSNNEEDYTFIGTLQQRGKLLYKHSLKSHMKETATSVKALAWTMKKLFDKQNTDAFKINHEGKCGRCGRKLTVAASVESGYGPECINKVFG